jgi:hypothetical protein
MDAIFSKDVILDGVAPLSPFVFLPFPKSDREMSLGEEEQPRHAKENALDGTCTTIQAWERQTSAKRINTFTAANAWRLGADISLLGEGMND